MLFAGFHDFLALLETHRHRFFDVNVFARFSDQQGQGLVRRRRGGHVNRVDTLVGQQLFARVVGFGHAVPLRKRPRQPRIGARHGGER